VRRASLALCVVLVAAGAGAWRSVEPPLELSFPRDHGAHPDYRTEWWYATGIVRGGDGRTFGYQLTFFRQGVDPSPPRPGDSDLRARQIKAAHLAVADVSDRRFRYGQRLRRTAGGLAGFATGDLDLWVDDWTMRRATDGSLTLAATDRDSGIAVDLRLAPRTPLVPQGEGGVSRKGPEPGNASAYVSWTRLETRGTVRLDGSAWEVTGTSWFDHEWGSTELGAEVVGWDWVGLRLEDGRDLMLYRLRRADGSASPFSAGTLVGRDGATTHLAADAFSWEALSTWTSPHTKASYPARVRVRVPSAGLDLRLSPLLADAEVDARPSTGTVYWEGPVRVSGSTAGEGYMELTGYASSLGGRL
jgi:predicted secreted hydrolase